MSDGKKHALFSPSSADRWIRCPGSMAFPENQAQGASSIYADRGTARHEVATWCFKQSKEAYAFIGQTVAVGTQIFEIDEEFAAHVQTYVDDVWSRSMGAQLLVEQQVRIEEIDSFGTSDAIIIHTPITASAAGVDAEVVDAKFGHGEPVYAWMHPEADAQFTVEVYKVDESELPDIVEPNYQLMLYAVGSLELIRMLLDQCRHVRLVINQPPLGVVSELVVTPQILERFALYAADAKKEAEYAMTLPLESVGHRKYLKAGEKQCRWCRAPHCSARDAKVEEEVGDDFEVIEAAGGVTKIPQTPEGLSQAFRVIPFIRDWIKQVETQGNAIVAAGGELIGIDRKPMKFVEGKLGDRAYTNEKEAEAALLGQLPEDQVYQPRKIISASQCAKKFDKKKSAELWADVFAPLIKRPPGKPILVLGSDPRAPYVGAAKGDEFESIEQSEE